MGPKLFFSQEEARAYILEGLSKAFEKHRNDLQREAGIHQEIYQSRTASLLTPLIPTGDCQADIASLRSLIPQYVPEGVSLIRNMYEASRMTAIEFYLRVRNGGEWDYKQRGQKYQNFGNFNYGVVARAFGWTESLALRAAGAAQMLAGTSERGPFSFLELSDPPFGDDEVDQEWIRRGFEYYDRVMRENEPGEPKAPSWECSQKLPRVAAPSADVSLKQDRLL